MTSRTDDRSVPSKPQASGAVDAFLSQAARAQPSGRGRLVFALDATASRRHTWDVAAKLQGVMFETAAALGGLDAQLVYFRGLRECRASSFTADASSLATLMTRIEPRAGETQIGRVLRHVAAETRRARIGALVYVGDAMEEKIDELAAPAGELGLLGVKAFLFQEGFDSVAGAAFADIARLTGGATARFDLSAPEKLKALLSAAAAYASGGRVALERQARAGGEAARLLAQMR